LRRIFLITIFLISFSIPSVARPFWPFLWELDGEKNFIGPLFSYKKDERKSAVAVRPILFSYDSKEEGVYRYFFPLGKSTKDISYFIPFYVRKNGNEAGNTAFFPFFWGASKKGSYFGIFPLYGKLYDRFNKDEMGFFLWPLYSYSEIKGAKKTNILWPFFAIYSGREKGIKFWPVFGFREIEGVSNSGFFLWPVFSKIERGLNTDDPFRSFYALPFYMDSESKKSEFKSIMWPIYTKSKTEYKTQTDIIWPIFKKIEGEDREGLSFFPLYTYERNEKDVKYSILWPVYRDSEWFLGEKRHVNRSYFILNRYIEDENTTFFNIWPFFEYRTNGNDYNFYFPSILPFRHEGIDVILKPLITFYERKKTGDRVVNNLLYGLYTKEETENTWKARFAFLLEIKKDLDGIGFELFSGLFGVDKKRIKVLFIPFGRNARTNDTQ